MILEVKGLSRSFGGLKAVSDVSTGVAENAIHSIIGPNGAGKTTLFNLITGALEPETGRVSFQGIDVTGWHPDRLARAGMARTFQRTSIFGGLPVEENVALAVRSRRGLNQSVFMPRATEEDVVAEAHDILAKVGLRGKEKVPAGSLAHGFQRALDIAVGLALQPKIILMDEPLAGMSRGDRETVAGLVTRLRAELGLTIIIVEHDVGMVMRLSDTITVMHHGEVIAEGPPATIREDDAVKKAYLHGSFAA